MDLENLNNASKAIRTMRMALFLVLVLSVGSSVFTVIYMTNKLENAMESIFVLDKNGALTTAERRNINDPETRMFEQIHHIELAFTYIYQFDEGSYDQNLSKALPLFGQSGYDIQQQYVANNIKRKLLELNLRYEVEIERIEFIGEDAGRVNYKVYATRVAIRPSGKEARRWDAQVQLTDYDRSRENPHGIKMEILQVFNDSIIHK